jgi:hypothetical protein
MTQPDRDLNKCQKCGGDVYRLVHNPAVVLHTLNGASECPDRDGGEKPQFQCDHKCHKVGLNPWIEVCPVCGCPNDRFKPGDRQ